MRYSLLTSLLLQVLSLLVTSFNHELRAQLNHTQPLYLIGLQTRMPDLVPLYIQAHRVSKKLKLSLTVTYWKNDFPEIFTEAPAFVNSNYGYSIKSDFETISFKPGIGKIYTRSSHYMASFNVNFPIAYNTYNLHYIAEDNLLGTHQSTYSVQKWDMGFEIEQASRYRLMDWIAISGGIIVGFVYSPRTIFKEFPTMDSYYKYAPGIGYGQGIYFSGYIGIQYILYGK